MIPWFTEIMFHKDLWSLFSYFTVTICLLWLAIFYFLSIFKWFDRKHSCIQLCTCAHRFWDTVQHPNLDLSSDAFPLVFLSDILFASPLNNCSLILCEMMWKQFWVFIIVDVDCAKMHSFEKTVSWSFLPVPSTIVSNIFSLPCLLLPSGFNALG